WQALHDSYLVLVAEYQNSANVVSRYVGGVQVNRAMIGQPGAITPFVPVTRTEQRRAMRTLADHVFAPLAFRSQQALYSALRQQRRGFDFYEVTEDPKLADLMLAVHKGVLDHLLHPAVQRRITDSTLYGNDYPLVEVMQDLTGAVFSRDLNTSVDPMRQNLQIEYVTRLLAMLEGETAKTYDYVSQSTALANLRRIESLLEGNRGPDPATRAHRERVLYMIRRGLDESA
ncbi:MAG: hypothetical protein HKN35_05950, partial [Woeseia sp.]|nr:hypothetical protein [Woeseia sp.]